MTSRAGSMSIDGTPISAADRARMAAEEALLRQRQLRAVRVIAGQAQDVNDCRMLLDILGLDATIAAEALGRKPAKRRPAAKSSTPKKTTDKPGSRRRGRAA